MHSKIGKLYIPGALVVSENAEPQGEHGNKGGISTLFPICESRAAFGSLSNRGGAERISVNTPPRLLG
jgi:hypothetical protein